MNEPVPWKEVIVTLSIILFLIAVTLGGCGQLNKKLGLKDDNVFEEILEHQIEDKTGLDIDLTPNSPE